MKLISVLVIWHAHNFVKQCEPYAPGICRYCQIIAFCNLFFSLSVTVQKYLAHKLFYQGSNSEKGKISNFSRTK